MEIIRHAAPALPALFGLAVAWISNHGDRRARRQRASPIAPLPRRRIGLTPDVTRVRFALHFERDPANPSRAGQEPPAHREIGTAPQEEAKPATG